MIFNEIKCRVNTSLGLVGEMHPLNPPLCPRLVMAVVKTICQQYEVRINTAKQMCEKQVTLSVWKHKRNNAKKYLELTGGRNS